MMPTTLRAAILVALLALLGIAAPAQTPKLPGFLAAARATVLPERAAPGERATLTFTLTTKAGFHIYAHDPGDRFLTATELTPRKAAGIAYGKIAWPEPTLHEKARIHEGTVTITVPLTVATNARPGTRKVGAIFYAQGCDATTCYPPTTFTVETTMNVTPAR